jgi:protein-disulfide isomerase
LISSDGGRDAHEHDAPHQLASPHKHRRRLADHESGVRSGVAKTPTLFINGRKYDGAIEAKAIAAAADPEV